MKAFIVFAASFVLGYCSVTQEAKCATCFDNPCTSAAFCGSGCVCLKRPFEIMGECVSIE